MANIYELLSRRQSELEDKEKELLILVKELESVQQELDDIRQMTNIRLLEPAQEVQETEAPLSPESIKKVDVSDLLLQKEQWEAKYGPRLSK